MADLRWCAPLEEVMDQGSAGVFPGPWIDATTPPSRRWAQLVLVLLLGATLGSGLTALTNARSTGAPAEPAVFARVSEPYELPREWRWEPRSVEYEHMFREDAGASAHSMFRSR